MLNFYSPFYAKFFSSLFRHAFCNTLHFCDEFFLTLVPPYANSKEEEAGFQLKDDNLKAPRRLYSPLSAHVHPFDIRKCNFPLTKFIVKNEFVLCDHQLPIADLVENEHNTRKQDEEDDHINNRVLEDKGKFILDKTSSSTSVNDERQKIDQCLLVVKI